MPLDLTTSTLSQKNIDPKYLSNFSQFLAKAKTISEMKPSKQRQQFQSTIDVIDRQLNIKRKPVSESDQKQTLIIHYFFQSKETTLPDSKTVNLKLITLPITDSKHNVELLYNRLKYLAERFELVLSIRDIDIKPDITKLTLDPLQLYMSTSIFVCLSESIPPTELNQLRYELFNAKLPQDIYDVSFSKPYINSVPLFEKILDDNFDFVDSRHTYTLITDSAIVATNIILNQILS